MSAKSRRPKSPRVSPSPRPGTGMSTKDRDADMDKIEEEGFDRRPHSSSSRAAWDNDGFDMGTEERELNSSFGRREGENEDNSEDGDDDNPMAMESEVYVGGQMRVVDPNTAKERELQQKAGCWTKFKRFLRSFWRTRQTDDTKADKELHVRTTLRELAIYMVFLIVICIVTFGMTSSTMYYYTKVMSELFLDSQYPDTKNTYRGSTTMADFWRFSQNVLMDGLYWEKWYNDENVTRDEWGYIFYENKMLGIPRLRQLKVRNDSCIVHDHFADIIKTCYAPYAPTSEDTESFGIANGTAWVYTTEAELDGSSHWGKLASYSGGGFYEDLTDNRGDSILIINNLMDNLWLDRGTRVVMVDFTVYNANINLFCIVRMVMEFPATGGAIPSWNFRTVKLLRYITAFDFFVRACECIFVLFVMYYIVEEVIEIRKHRMSYFKTIWNCLDVIIIIISVLCMVFSVYRTMAVNRMIETLLSQPEQYADFEFLGYCQGVFNNVIAIAVFLAWVKVFKYISFNKTMTQLSSTLSKCAKDVGGFTVMFLIIFLAYAQLGYLVFGTQIKDFHTIGSCVFTLFRIILGDFDFHELEAANRILGPMFFMTYVFVVFFVLLNMFLAIINDTYSEVKADIANQTSEFEITDYFKKGYEKMVGKLNFKRDKIADIQEALAHADHNADQHLDFDEWRMELKARGHADTEIEAVFAKYDVDGDRILDAEEQMKMASDLETQKSDLNNQLAELEESNAVGARPGTSQSNGSYDEDDEDGGGRRGGGGVSGVSYEEFVVLSRRVDRMEHSIGSIVSKIDAVLVKLEAMERAKLKRRETMGKLLDNIKEDEEGDGNRREQMEQLVREELERWDSDASLSNRGGGGGSTSSGRHSAARSVAAVSRPGSSVSQRHSSASNHDDLDAKSIGSRPGSGISRQFSPRAESTMSGRNVQEPNASNV